LTLNVYYIILLYEFRYIFNRQNIIKPPTLEYELYLTTCKGKLQFCDKLINTSKDKRSPLHNIKGVFGCEKKIRREKEVRE